MYTLHKTIPKDLPAETRRYLNNAINNFNRFERHLFVKGFVIKGKSIAAVDIPTLDSKKSGKVGSSNADA